MPVDGRFEHIVLSCNATSDHAIIWIEREAERALEVSLTISFIFMEDVKQVKLILKFRSNLFRIVGFKNL